jgi:chromosome segregation ATPase
MFKFMLKTALVGAIAAGSAFAYFGPHKLENWFHSGKKAVEERINELQGMSAELHRIESRVDQLDQEIADLKENMLREEIEVQNLEKEIGGREESRLYLRENLEKAHTLLESDMDRFQIRGITYTRHEIEQDVAEKMRLFQVQEETLAQLRQTLDTRRNALDIARENVSRGQAVREEMIGKVRLLQAKVERYKARQVYAEAVAMDFDAQEFNTELGEARSQLAKFEQKLEVKNRMLDERMRVATSGQKAVAGIDYTAQAQVETGLKEQLHELLTGKRIVPSASSEPVAAAANR